ncbi:MAG: triple tyrosine motif-containing protein [Saprospiraceae bacterium]
MININSIKNFLFHLFLILITFSSKLYGQQGSLLFHYLKLEDGLSDLTNQYVSKDSEGFIWISSISGLNRFDGTVVKRYFPNPDDSLAIQGGLIQSNFFEDTSSHLWFTTYNAINGYDRQHDCFHHYTVPDSIASRLVDYHVFYLDPRNELWLVTDDSILRTFNVYSHKFSFVAKLKSYCQRANVIKGRNGQVKRIYGYAQPASGILEIIFDEHENVSDQTFISTLKRDDLARPKKIVPDGDSVIWIIAENLLVKYNFLNKSVRSLPVKDVLAIEMFNDSVILVSIEKKGVFEFNKNAFSFGFEYISENNNSLSLLTNTINYISKDIDKGFWFSSSDFGLSYAYVGKKKFSNFHPLTKKDPVNSNFNAKNILVNHAGLILCNTGSGLFELDKGCRIIRKIEIKDLNTTNRLNTINHFFEDNKNRLWLNTFFGLSFIWPSLQSAKHLSSFPKVFIEGIELKDGRLIFASNDKGLFELKGSIDSLNQIRPDSLNRPYQSLMQDRRARIWMNDGLDNYIVLDPNTFNKIAEIPITGIYSMMAESGDGRTIWIASSDGLYDIDAENLKLRKFYNESKGIPSVGLNSILIDKTGKLWITSKIGIIVFNPENGNSTVYNFEDGLPSTNFNNNSAVQFEDGEMWFGSPNGITKFNPDKLQDIQIKAIPQITGLLINDQPPVNTLVCEKTASTNISEIKKLTFSYRDRTLTFLVNSLEFSAPKRNKVRYWLEGFDKDTIEVPSGSRIRYPNLPSKHFTFCLQAANSDGKYSDDIRKLEIFINPPFYKTWWFILSMILLTLGPIAYIIYLRISKKIELQNVRLRLYENLHDDVGSRLSAIALSAQELLRQDQTGNPKVQQISKVANSIVGNMRRLVWAIDPDNDSMNSLVEKIRHDKSFILDEAVEFHLDLDPHLSPMIVPGEVRYQLTSIVNEALNNISKYAKAKNVWIQLTKKERELNMVIRDDGVGFNIENVTNDKVKASGYGLGNMQKRVARVKGSISINSLAGEGTTILVSIPIK